MQFEASVRKAFQLSREIQEQKPHQDLQHSVWKLLSFLETDVPGWKEAAKEYRLEPDDA